MINKQKDIMKTKTQIDIIKKTRQKDIINEKKDRKTSKRQKHLAMSHLVLVGNYNGFERKGKCRRRRT